MIANYRLLVADVDGTIIGPDLRPSARVRSALDTVREAGWQVALCTGRGPHGCARVSSALELDGFHIFHNGALVCDPSGSQIVAERHLGTESVLRLIEAATAMEMTLELYTADRYFIARGDWLTELHSRSLEEDPVLTDLVALAMNSTIIKGELLVADDRQQAGLRTLEEQFKGVFSFDGAPIAVDRRVICVNVVADGVSKGSGVESLASHYGIPLSEVVAVGDGMNDIPLIKAAGLGVAMGNASERVKISAGFVTESVELDGLAMLLERLLVGEMPLPFSAS